MLPVSKVPSVRVAVEREPSGAWCCAARKPVLTPPLTAPARTGAALPRRVLGIYNPVARRGGTSILRAVGQVSAALAERGPDAAHCDLTPAIVPLHILQALQGLLASSAVRAHPPLFLPISGAPVAAPGIERSS